MVVCCSFEGRVASRSRLMSYAVAWRCRAEVVTIQSSCRSRFKVRVTVARESPDRATMVAFRG